VPPGTFVLASLPCRFGFGVGAGRVEFGVGRTEPDQAQFFADVLGRPAGFGGVGVADQPEPAVGHGAHVGAVGGAKGEEGLVPGGALVGAVVGGFGADGVGGVLVAVHLPVGRYRGHLLRPVLSADGIVGDGAKRLDRP
jgi:hypothetical protein